MSLKKLLLQGGDIIRHLGMDLDFRTCSIWVSESKVMGMKSLMQDILEHHRQGVVARKVAALVGKLVSVRVAVPLVTVLSKGLNRSIAHLSEDVDGNVEYDTLVYLSPLAIAELRLWCDCFFRIRSSMVDKVGISLFLTSQQRGVWGLLDSDLLNMNTSDCLPLQRLLNEDVKDSLDVCIALIEVCKLAICAHANVLRGKLVHIRTTICWLLVF